MSRSGTFRTKDIAGTKPTDPPRARFGSPLFLAAGLACLLLAAVASAAACGGRSAPSPSPSTTAADAHRAAEAYFAAMAPTIERDYRLAKRVDAIPAFEAEHVTPATIRGLRGIQTAEQDVMQAYELVAPPPEFESAHTLLLRLDRLIHECDVALVRALASDRPVDEWLPQIQSQRQQIETLTTLFVDQITAAAEATGVKVPEKLLAAYEPTSPEP